MTDNYKEEFFAVSFPTTHELASYVPREPGSDHNQENLRTRAAIGLKEAFGVNVSTLEEQRLDGELSLFIAVNTGQVEVEEFRRKVAELAKPMDGVKIEKTEYRGRH